MEVVNLELDFWHFLNLPLPKRVDEKMFAHFVYANKSTQEVSRDLRERLDDLSRQSS